MIAGSGAASAAKRLYYGALRWRWTQLALAMPGTMGRSCLMTSSACSIVGHRKKGLDKTPKGRHNASERWVRSAAKDNLIS